MYEKEGLANTIQVECAGEEFAKSWKRSSFFIQKQVNHTIFLCEKAKLALKASIRRICNPGHQQNSWYYAESALSEATALVL